MLDQHVIQPTQDHCITIIFLHGRDSTGTTFADEIFESESKDDQTLPELLPTAKWIFPTASALYSKTFDCEMCQWFDMHSTQAPQEIPDTQCDGLRRNIEELIALIETEANCLGWDNIILAGISQGAALCIHALLRLPSGVAGLVALSSWFALGEKARPYLDNMQLSTQEKRQSLASLVGPTVSILASTIPVFVGHCSDDDIIKVCNGVELAASLRKLGMEVEWHEYSEGGHWLNEPQGVDDLITFISRVSRSEKSSAVNR